MKPPRERTYALIGAAAEAQARATAKALSGRRSVKRLLTMMTKALARVEKLVKRVNSLDPPPRPIACGPGCPFCCHIRLTASPPEILLIAEHVRSTWPADRLAALKTKLANLDRLTHGRDGEAREAMRLPCPMLLDNSCGIHVVRPISCRAVASVDVAACRRFYDSRMQAPVPQVTMQLNAANGVGYGLMAGLAEAGYGLENLEFIAALRIALEQDSAGKRWLDGEGVFKDAS